MATKNEINYEEAAAELEKIVSKMSSDEVDVDTMAADVKRAQQLLKLCEAKLHKTDEEVKALLESLKPEA